ncbi:hypothetical protein H2200_003039 [Cladophialophora chaetospira]|uniref:Tachykinin family protein n=1 Tax=Cladophialophora chaetospira TaxID=386627 RepID=A0AA39CMD0_9EURO|nr:hypothetical protein H2200_003039 [Cladophialophora chaetospira]
MSPPQRYSFVNARPQTKAEKRQTRTAIRSHIGRWTQEKQQKLEGNVVSASEKDSPPESSRTVSLSPGSTDQTRPRRPDRVASVWSESVEETSDSRSSLGGTEHDADDISARALVSSVDREWEALPPNTIVQVLGSGILDPFRTYPSNFPSALVSQAHEYWDDETIALKVLWPGLTPRPLVGAEPPASKAWFPMALNDPVALHSLLFGALSHKRLNLLRGAGAHVNLDVASLEVDMRRCEIESIALINKALRKDNTITDAMIVSVLCMAANAWDLTLERFLEQSAPAPVFDPLLKSLQWLDIYGLLSVHPTHAAGLVQLIKLRGGLHKIQTPGLAATVFYSGIINASKSLTAPIFPFIPLAEGDDQNQNETLWSLLGTSPSELRDEFVFNGLFDLGLTDELALVLVAMQRYGQCVQLFVDGVLPDLDLARFCDRRNLIQHTLLTLPSDRDLPDPSSPHPIYEPTRLAMVIYSLTVIFPLPPQTAPLAVLTGQLKAALQATDLRSSWSSSHQARRLLIWVLCIGAVAARDVPEDRSWFVAVLRRLTAKETRLKQFENLKRDVLSRILWLDRSCDAAGRFLWKEVMDLGN